MSNRINICEVELDKRMFQMNVEDVQEAPWLKNIDTSKYSSLQTKQLQEFGPQNNTELPKNLTKDDLAKHEIQFLNPKLNLVNEKISEKQKELVRDIPMTNPTLKYMKINKMEYDSFSSGMSNTLEASFFVFDGKVPVTEVCQVNFHESASLFHLFGRKINSLIVPYTSNEETRFLCILKMITEDKNSSPFAIGQSKFDEQNTEMTFRWIPFQPDESLPTQLKRQSNALNIKITINVTYNVQPEDGITARITPYDPMMPSPFLTIYGLHVTSSLEKNYKVKIYLENDDEEVKATYAKPTAEKLADHFKSHTVVSRAQLFFPEPITFLLDPSYNKVYTIVVTVNEVALLKSKERVTYSFRLERARKKVENEKNGTKIDFEYFYPSLIAPNEELRLPMQQEGIPPMFESTVFDDLWPHILIKNLNSNTVSLNFLSVILSRIQPDKLSSFTDRYFHCTHDFMPSFLSKMKESPPATERIAQQLFPILFKSLCIYGELSPNIVSYLQEISSSEGLPATKSAAIAMLLRMRRFFNTKEVDDILFSFIKKLNTEEALKAFSIILSDGNYVSDVCSLSKATSKDCSSYSKFTSFFFSLAYKYCNDEKYKKLICTDLSYLANTLERFAIDGFAAFLPVLRICYFYNKTLQKEIDISVLILAILNSQNTQGINIFLSQISNQSRLSFISLLKSFCTDKIKALRVFRVLSCIETVNTNMLDLIICTLFDILEKFKELMNAVIETLAYLIEKHQVVFFSSEKTVHSTIAKCVALFKKQESSEIKLLIEFMFEKEANEVKKTCQEGLIITALDNYETLDDVLDFLGKMEFAERPEFTGKSMCYIEEELRVRSIALKYKDAPGICSRLLSRIVKISEENKDFISAFIAQCKLESTAENQKKAIELAQKAELHNHVLNIPINNFDPSLLQLISKSTLAITENNTKELKYWRVFVSGPVANVFGGSDFIYLGNNQEFIDLIQKNYQNVKVNSKQIPMFGTFATTTIQVLPVRQKDETTFEYDFIMPDGQWNDVLAIRYSFVTEEKAPGPVCLLPAKSTTKEQISKIDIYTKRLQNLTDKIEEDEKLIKEYLPCKKLVNDWCAAPAIPATQIERNIMKSIKQSEDPSIALFQTIAQQKKQPEDTPETFIEVSKQLLKAIEKASDTLKHVDELEKKNRFTQTIEEINTFLTKH